VRYRGVEKNREERNSYAKTADANAKWDIEAITCRELHHCGSKDGAQRAIRNLKWTFLCHVPCEVA
jgi:hypothetical protein